MAAGDLASRSGDSSLQLLNSLLTTFKGSPTTTQSTSETVSEAKAQEYIRTILGGTSGLAAISGMQKGAGLYNSTVNKQLTNDLLARTSAQTAALSSVKTTTAKTGAQPGSTQALLGILGNQALSKGASKLAAPSLNILKKKLGFDADGVAKPDILDSWGNDLANSLFGGGGANNAILSADASVGISPFAASFDKLPVDSALLQDTSDITQTARSSGSGAGASLVGSGAGFAADLLGASSASTGLTGGGYAIAADGTLGLFSGGATAAGAEAGAGLGAAAVAEGAGAGISAAGAAGSVGLGAAAGYAGLFNAVAGWLQTKDTFSFADLIKGAASGIGEG